MDNNNNNSKKKRKSEPPEKLTADQDATTNIWWWVLEKGSTPSFIIIGLFAFLVRVCVSIHPYSGANTPPKYGDYEAQRHWMEITINLPVQQWYRNSTANDLVYWGLDYPPLTAYQSFFHGCILKFFDPPSVALYTSRGYESYVGKLLMRWTVLSSDALIFFPAVFYFMIAYYSGKGLGKKSGIAWHIAMILLNPGLILIDHGHFQYNCISLGLTVAAVAAILSDRDVIGSILYCLALNHKQVLSRLAPFERGIYEDYVANFWCTTSVLVKWKRLFTTDSLRLISLSATVATCLPSTIQLIWAPTKKTFLYGLLSSSFSFYLFSFQVHEKSILLPLLPASFLALEEPLIFFWVTHYALLSMFPLLSRDKLVLPYIALYGLFTLIYHGPGGRQDTKKTSTAFAILKSFFYVCSLSLHIIHLTVTPPRRYPFLFEAIIMLFCFSQFMLVSVYSHTKQWTLMKFSIHKDKVKKHI